MNGMANVQPPLFQQLARTLTEAIDSGAIAVGDLLPTEHELARRHRVSRHTVREALNEIRTRGLIESRQGVGSIVVRRTPQSDYTESYSSIEELTRFAAGTPIRTLRAEDVLSDAPLAQLLRGRPGQQYLKITGFRGDPERAAIPTCFVEVYVDAIYSGIRDEVFTLKAAVVQTIEQRYGVSVARVEQELSTELLSAEAATTLNVATGTPALVIRRWYVTDSGRVFEIAFSHYPIGQFTYRNVLVRRRGAN